jgi:3',5'-nucleoside bisphosphate phosphatase
MEKYGNNLDKPATSLRPQGRRRYEPPIVTSSVDLHTHTFFSDGRASPEELVSRAARLGIKTLAITDHDNLRGVREAQPLARLVGVELIPAAEFTSRWDECPSSPEFADIDVLGYFLDIDDPALQAFEKTALDDIHSRMAECCLRLTEAGYPISMEDVFAWNPRYGGTMFLIDALVAKGHAPDFAAGAELCNQFWGRGRLSSHTIQDVITAIRRSGGVPVLAHPILVRCNDNWLTEVEMARLVEMGLQGIEVYHFRMNDSAQLHFLELAKRFDLVVTGGSDEHGWPQGFHHLGHQLCTEEMVEELRQRSGKKH